MTQDNKFMLQVGDFINQLNQVWLVTKSFDSLKEKFDQNIILLISDNQIRLEGIDDAISYYKDCAKFEVVIFNIDETKLQIFNNETFVYSYKYSMKYRKIGEKKYKMLNGYDLFILKKIKSTFKIISAIV